MTDFRWQRALCAALVPATRLPEEDSTTGMNQEELQRLKSLGYIQ